MQVGQDHSLLILLDKARTMTLSTLADIPEEWARWLPAGEANHILWHAGHIFVLLERCLYAAEVGAEDMPATIPAGWWPLFGWNSQPWTIGPAAWPTLAEVRAQLQAQTARLQQKLASFDEAFLGGPIAWPDPRWFGKPRRLVIVHGLYDELLHTGQIMQLKRLAALHHQSIGEDHGSDQGPAI